MRPIKFRAWDTDAKDMISWNEIIHSEPNSGLNMQEILLSQPFIPMQYTGLQDKNGKDIYEGDIFEAPHDFGPGGFDVRRAVVRFHETQGYQWNYWLIEQLEIIGNVHENPELIKEG